MLGPLTNTIPISSYTLSVLCPLTKTTQFQFHLAHCLCCALLTNTTHFQFHRTHCLCCALWPTQHNSNFILQIVFVAPFDQHNTIPISSYTLSVLRPLTNTTQFQFHPTHCLCCALWPTQRNSNFILHIACRVQFIPSRNQYVRLSTSCVIRLWILPDLQEIMSFKMYILLLTFFVSVSRHYVCNLPLFGVCWESLHFSVCKCFSCTFLYSSPHLFMSFHFLLFSLSPPLSHAVWRCFSLVTTVDSS